MNRVPNSTKIEYLVRVYRGKEKPHIDEFTAFGDELDGKIASWKEFHGPTPDYHMFLVSTMLA